MVWCARESADFEPGASSTMQLLEPYGWIHWSGKTWHTVTGYELGNPDEPVTKRNVPFSSMLAPLARHQAPGETAADILKANEQSQAGASTDVPIDPAIRERQAAAPVDLAHNAAPASPPPSNGDPSAWDTDHKRDEDRADTQRAVDNTRWDTQHTLDNSRWDTRRTLANTRWDTQHTLDNSRWDTRHTLDNTRWDTSLALKRAREDTALAADMAMLSAVHGGYLAVAQSSLDRAVQRATYVATAAGAIGTIYTAILAARYTAGHPALPARSIIPALFIGAAVAFSTWYMAFLRGKTRNQQLLLSGTGGSVAETRLLDFMEWTFAGVLARAWSLRVSVISLALGLALLPLGLVQLSSAVTWIIGVVALAILVAWLVGELYIALNGPPDWAGTFLDNIESQRPRLTDIPSQRPKRTDTESQGPKATLDRPNLPPKPTSGVEPTGPASYGMVYPPPAAPQRADGANPPPPPDIAAKNDPPVAPKGATDADPPSPPEVAVGPPPKRPEDLAPDPRPPARQQPPRPTELKVDLHIADDRGQPHP
jgi:hypothetical protein